MRPRYQAQEAPVMGMYKHNELGAAETSVTYCYYDLGFQMFGGMLLSELPD